MFSNNSVSKGLSIEERIALRLRASGLKSKVSAALFLSAASLALPLYATAQESTAPADDTVIDDVVVTGTRVVRDGYEAPTPVSVVTAEELRSFAAINVADSLNTLPSLAGSVTPAASQTTASTGNSGINALNLRNIGTTRTLVMLNGQRIVASSSNGLVDINNIPQELIKRVEVVTGGASASWGSDAVGGVVNFILDTEYTGLKTSFQAGTTSYGDNTTGRFTLTGGTDFADGRGHFLFSGSLERADPIIYNRRDWNLEGWQAVVNPAYNATTNSGVPQRLVLDQISTANGRIGGIITSGPLRGTAFGEGGDPYRFIYGTPYSSGQFMRGGPMWQEADIRGKHGSAPLASRMRGMGAFINTSWDLTDDVKVSLMASRNNSKTANWAFSLEDYGSVTIRTGNPFIPATVQAAMTANNLATISLGSMHPDLDIAVASGDRTVSRVALSLDGKFGDGWKWNAYYQYGQSKQAYSTPGMWNTAFLAKAYDAVVSPTTGQIICRVTLTNPADPCVPYNPMGLNVNSQAAVDYVEGSGITQSRLNYLAQNVASASIDGTPFSLWAGDVSVAAGAEWRKEWMGKSSVDQYSLLGQWWAGNSRPSYGSFDVKEVFVETVVPLAKDMFLARSLDLQAAVRQEDYSTSGSVTAWKLGATWKPIDDITVRGSLSHDIRAPNLIELYSSGTASAPFILDPWQPSIPSPGYGISVLNVGNPNLKPEKADSWGAGVVFQPAFLPGFGASVDYWETEIEDAIGTALTEQQIVDNCFGGQTDFCSLIDYAAGPGSRILTVRRAPVNNANARYRGVDYEASYQFAPSFLPGNFALRFLATNFLQNSSVNNGIETEVAGQNSTTGGGGTVPDWRFTATLGWTLDAWRSSVTARGLSSGTLNNYFVECTTGCPVSTTRAVTINDNSIAGAIYFDTSISRDFEFGSGSKANVFFNVRNVLDRDPAIAAAFGSFADTLSPANANLYDVLGRVLNAGVRVEF
jgi:outer membrane receptor protein involved in Fe transport